MKRVLSISCVLAVALALSAIGCKKSDKDKGKQPKTATPDKGKEEPPPPPKELTSEDMVKRMNECWAAFSKKDKDTLAGCFAEDATSGNVDHLPPMMAEGRDNIMKMVETTEWAMVSELSAELQLLMVSGNKMAGIVLNKAKHTGDMPGMKATGKPMGFYYGTYVETNKQGEATLVQHWIDQNTIAGQLGMMPKEAPPTIPVQEKGWDEKVVVIAKDDDKEKANLEVANAHLKAFNEHDMKALMATYADDVVVHVWGMPPTEGGKKIKKEMAEYFASFPDVKEVPTWTLAAGDYVAAACASSGTFKKAMKGPPKMKPTGKSFSMSDLIFFHIADGKIKQEWIFGNGYTWAVQLGIAPSPEEMMKKGAPPAEPKKGAAPAPKKGAAPAEPKKAVAPAKKAAPAMKKAPAAAKKSDQ